MSDFLLELRSEEIPARMQAGARGELARLFRREMEAVGLTVSELTVWSTPRRLALIARDLPQATEAVSEEAKGPPEGAPDAAIDGFCRKSGVTRDQLELRDVKGRNTWFAVIEKPGRAVKDVLADAIPAIIRDFSWPKSMRWGAASISTESLRWVRPLSGIVALLGDEIVECEVHGVTSGAVTLGHRFHHSGEITISGASDYVGKLRAAHVIVDHEERQDMIRQLAGEAARTAGFALVEDEGLVVENAGLTEWPVPLLGRFDREFLDVPPEVIQLTARVNQKYFVCKKPSPLQGRGRSAAGAEGVGPVTDSPHPPTPSPEGEGELANAFVCTANIESSDCGAAIVDGNRKVLAARLADARFFWEQDRKTPLAEHAKKLARITFHEKLGTVADKVERVAKLARWLVEERIVQSSPSPMARGTSGAGGGVASPTESDPSTTSWSPSPSGLGEDRARLADLAEQAARLCKADLVTEMVGEFPELQGVMGGYYARAEVDENGLRRWPDEVADAIRDHYKPVGQGDDVPTAPVTVAVSLADKLDTLAGFFVIGDKPSGSKDPFALRRAELGIIRIMTANRLRAGWNAMHAEASEGHYETALAAKLERYGPILSGLEVYRYPDRPDQDEEYGRGPEQILDWSFEAERISKGISAAQVPLADFLIDRLKVQQREAGVRHDLIDAVFALGGEDDLVRLLARVHALQAFVTTEDGANLLAGYKRAANILKKEDWANQPSPLQGSGRSDEVAEGVGDVSHATLDDSPHPNPSPEGEGLLPHTGDEDPLENVDDPDMRAVYAAAARDASAREAHNGLSYTPEPAEKVLIEALDAAEPTAASAIEAEDFAAAMSALASLRMPIDAFFEEVTVNADEEIKRRARLDLLARFRAAVHNVADFSKIEG
ncbi:glycine--tRNA ligase subunit beta [Parerythrobacter lacustris]|uniref:Glycine--tRNA ligase beta subunit n=1 Tax=Parerythrobacter lacustris TaxID=2969984 RepID=A0ABT1XQG2_9SPHN|nr:glycine--tRNA ligase subunit beta [Parerythrobacter lacustris]MCR2833904.1 glycine--tRNA ligase subunit beta [Parerythrobacter lacustris]